MTDGTSQGLFIVVAIVIFGIFVVLAYILFEDSLSPAMASMFNEATEQAYDKLHKNITDERFFDIDEEGKITAYRDDDLTDDKELPTDVVIPNKVKGVTVKAIGKGSFTQKGITSLVLPKTLEIIENGRREDVSKEGAFYGNNIQKVTIPKNVKYIGKEAFAKNPLTEGVFFEKGVNLELGPLVFYDTELTEITIPERVKDMQGGIFEKALKLSTFSFEGERSGKFNSRWFSRTNLTGRVEVPYGFTEIGEYALAQTKMSELYIPETVTKLEKGFAYKNDNLTVIHLPKHLEGVIESDDVSKINLVKVKLEYY